MKKISISVLVLAVAFSITASATTTATTTAATTTATTTRTEGHRGQMENHNKNSKVTREQIKKADAACAVTAITKRDSAITAALQKYTTGWINSINTRRAAQTIAFSKEGGERLNLVKTSESEAKKTQRLIEKELNGVKSTAATTYKGELRACGYDTESSNE